VRSLWPEPGHGEIALVGTAAPARDRDPITASLRDLAKRVLGGNDFEALGIEPSASDLQVHRAYMAILQQIPKIEPTAANLVHSQKAKRIRNRIEAAYTNLRDEEKRRAYSLLQEEEEQDRKAKPSAERALEGERWFRKGKAHLEQKRSSDAVEAFGMASHLDPEQGEYASHLGYALYLTNPTDEVVQREAMEHLACGIKRSPRHELSYVFLGRILIEGAAHQARLPSGRPGAPRAGDARAQGQGSALAADRALGSGPRVGPGS
jgi:tetratricopeptide (TPR) repeat protein